MIDPLISTIVQYGFSMLFLTSAWHKLSDLQRFILIIEDYQLLTVLPSNFLAILLILIEFLIGTAWFFGYNLAIIGYCSIALLSLYAGAITINLLRGRIYIDCGCSFYNSSGGDSLLSPLLVFRNVILILLAALPILSSENRSLVIFDYVIIFCSLLSIISLYAGSTQLVKNRSAINSWRNK